MFGNWKQTWLRAGAAVTLLALLPVGVAQAQDDAGMLIPMDHPAAPFLESRAFAKAQGATAEFRKMEWVAHDPVNNRMYWAMSEVSKGMTDGEGAVNVEENLCGIVYAADLDAENNVTKIYPYIVGGPYDESNADNPCAVDNIANPDNLVVDSNGNLWIGEDTSNHRNNMLWMYDGTTLKRFGTVPPGWRPRASASLPTARSSSTFSTQVHAISTPLIAAWSAS
ncbi:MAG: DUF839 domain-containing protein [Anaerolineales bacterium]|nr:DUF839 domain-containing protein [Anaerolineales bacterium]